MKSQVTTKCGDEGKSSALCGGMFPKSHPIMECVGAVDELRAHVALLRLEIQACGGAETQASAEFLYWLLHSLFAIGSACSDPFGNHPEFQRHPLAAKDLAKLEAEQARIEALTPLPPAFIVSAANRTAAQADVAATVARRLERSLVRLKEAVSAFDCALLMVFVNRLSDYLFILARHLDGGQHQTVDYGMLD